MQLNPAQQKTYLAFKDREAAEEYKRQCLVCNDRQNKKVVNPQKPETRPCTERESFYNWIQESKKFKLVRKKCFDLKVGDIFQASVEPYFCEVIEILPSEILLDHRLMRLKLLPDGLIGEGVFLRFNRFFWVKSNY